MKRLILDTSTDYFFISFVEENKILSERYEYAKGNQSEIIMVNLENMLKETSLSLSDFSEVYVGIGPGSYTGLRVAVTIAKMLVTLSHAKLFSFSTLSLIASSKLTESYPLIDARRGNAYLSHYDYKNNKLIKLEEDKVVSIDDYFKSKDRSLIVSEGKPNVLVLLDSMLYSEVSDADALTPNYLQLVEAERKRRGLD